MISLNDIFVQFKQICAGRFLLGLRELLNLERILQYRSFIKENINLLKKDPAPENQECVTVLEDIFDTKRSWIAKTILHENSAEVATTVAKI